MTSSSESGSGEGSGHSNLSVSTFVKILSTLRLTATFGVFGR
jgi:hypothetical protein